MNPVSINEWQKFAKGKGYKDTALVKALGAVEAADEDADRRLDALEAVAHELAALRRAHKGDAKLDERLGDIDKALPKLRKAAQEQARSKADDETTDEEDGPAVLTTNLLALLRQVARGQTQHVLLGITAKQVVVMLARRPIGAGPRKLLVGYADDPGGMKFVTGECVFEAGTHTFVVASKAAGLAKRIKAGLHAQTGLRCKVRVRGEAGDLDEQADDDDTPAAGAEASTAPPAEAGVLKSLTARAASLQLAIQRALAGADAAVVKNLVVQFAQRTKAGDADAALQLLEQLEARLRQPAPQQAPSAGAGASRARVVDTAKCRLAWGAARRKVLGELQSLEQTILSELAEAPGSSELPTKLRKLDSVLAGFDDDLDTLLDQAGNAPDETARRAAMAQARQAVERFLQRASSDPFIERLQNNPFEPVTLKPVLVQTLATLQRQLA